ncbi:MAG TPA: hypothetical protein VM121_08935 [Acidimicrobiales bacterium]|nr:hypothetical protein [Acidimicrobiales bacterium]
MAKKVSIAASSCSSHFGDTARVNTTGADFDSWKSVFDEHAASRKAHGAVGHRVLRRSDEFNTVMVLTEFGDRSQAEAFLADPSLRAAMGRAGVEGVPEITFWEVAEKLAYSSIGV